jgi:putative inorganic carbon (HCO3(-)) transporter
MLYACLLLYITAIYIRPAEIFTSWATFPFIDVLSGVTAIVAVLSLALRPRPVVNLPHDKLVLAFWAMVALSSITIWFWSVYTAWLAFMPAVFCYFLIRAGVRTTRQLSGVIYLLILLNVFLAVNGVIQHYTGVGLGNVTMIDGRITGTGIFNDPNDLGMTLVMTMPFAWAIVANRDAAIFNRLWCIVAVAIILLALYYTNSRGAMVGLVTALVWFSFLRFQRVSAFVVATMLLLAAAAAAPSRADQITYTEVSAQSRIHSWAEGWEMLTSSPVTGVGYNRFTEFTPAVAHNSFVHTFAELGLLGAFCFVGMFYWYFKGLRRSVPVPGAVTPWRIALISSGAGVLGCIWFLSRQYIPVLYILLALGASAPILKPAAAHEIRMTWRDVIKIGGLTLAGLVTVYLSIRTMAIWGGDLLR